MNNPTLFSPLILNLFILSFFLLSYNFIEAIDKFYQTCSTVPKTCGDNQNITFPFYIQGLQEPYCGYPGFQVSCNNNGHPILNLSNEIYIIHKIFYQNQSLIVSNSAFSNPQTNYCIPFVQNLHLFSDRLQIIPNQSRVFLLYNCSSSLVKDFPKYNDIGCSVENRTRRVLGLSEKDKTQMDTNVSKCGKENLVVAPVMRYRDNNGDDENEINIREVLSRGFLMKWTASNCKFCEKSGGRCGFDHLNFLFKCYCPDRPHSARCDPLQKAEENIQNQPCPPSFLCGKLGSLTFPFNDNSQPLCGLYPINCTAPTPKIQLRKGGYWFQILNISQTNSIFINDTDLLPKMKSKNCESFASLALPDNSIVSNVSTSDSLTIFNCSSYDTNSSAYVTCGDYELYYNNTIKGSPPRCSIVRLPTSRLDISANPRCYSCLLKGSQCVSDERNRIKCSDVSKGGKKKLGLKLGLGIGCSIFVLCPLIFLIWRSYKKVQSSSNTISRNFSDPYSNSDLEGGSHYLGIPVFSYLDLVEATHYFDSKRELGDGGFGTVYYGVLKDGREVAVKRLYEHNCKRLHQFLNEIVILTRLGHKNLVSLYGCTSRHSRELLLVYEYIPNGTVADHLHGDRAKIGCLTWPIRMSIAIETAAALTYLHASDIIHRDVKTNNILLDNNFNVKVADFGLSRLFPNDVTHISTAPQGTPGYVDPSYHQCYQLTTKSDVYSFGVVLVELISSMPAVDITRHTHEISLANLAINKIQMSAIKEMVDQSLGFETDNEVRRKIIAFAELAFQCLQQDKEVRPSMQKVLEDLKRIESGKNERDAENEEELYDNFKVTDNVHPTASPDCDEISLLKNIKPPTSPISVTQNWPSNISTTPNVSS